MPPPDADDDADDDVDDDAYVSPPDADDDVHDHVDNDAYVPPPDADDEDVDDNCVPSLAPAPVVECEVMEVDGSGDPIEDAETAALSLSDASESSAMAASPVTLTAAAKKRKRISASNGAMAATAEEGMVELSPSEGMGSGLGLVRHAEHGNQEMIQELNKQKKQKNEGIDDVPTQVECDSAKQKENLSDAKLVYGDVVARRRNLEKLENAFRKLDNIEGEVGLTSDASKERLRDAISIAFGVINKTAPSQQSDEAVQNPNRYSKPLDAILWDVIQKGETEWRRVFNGFSHLPGFDERRTHLISSKWMARRRQLTALISKDLSGNATTAMNRFVEFFAWTQDEIDGWKRCVPWLEDAFSSVDLWKQSVSFYLLEEKEAFRKAETEESKLRDAGIKLVDKLMTTERTKKAGDTLPQYKTDVKNIMRHARWLQMGWKFYFGNLQANGTVASAVKDDLFANQLNELTKRRQTNCNSAFKMFIKVLRAVAGETPLANLTVAQLNAIDQQLPLP